MTRIRTLSAFDRRRARGSPICGVDEAGRGALAGPVVAAAVVLSTSDSRLSSPGGPLAQVDDSKKLTPGKREQLYDSILDHALDWSIGEAWPDEIDRINILEASLLAMTRALETLHEAPPLVLVDGNREPSIGMNLRTVVGGDGKSLSIACASILAKVTRDRIMRRLAAAFPDFGWARNKGYATLEHRRALLLRGRTVHHRGTFLRNLEAWRQRELFG